MEFTLCLVKSGRQPVVSVENRSHASDAAFRARASIMSFLTLYSRMQESGQGLCSGQLSAAKD